MLHITAAPQIEQIQIVKVEFNKINISSENSCEVLQKFSTFNFELPNSIS